MNQGEFVNRVINTLNSVSKDDRISKRYVLHVGRQKAEYFISQKLADRSLYREDNLYDIVECFEFEKQEIKKCDIIEFRRCKSLMKSKKKLPKLIYSKYGSSLKDVVTLDGEKEFKQITPSQYRRNNNRKGSTKFVYYYVKAGYIYLIDSEVETVDLELLTLYAEDLEKCSSCKKNTCKSLWDYEMNIPSKLLEVIIGETIKEIANKKSIPLDENPNMDQNIKTKTVQ